MQILNESGSGTGTDVVGKLTMDRPIASSSVRSADMRRAAAERGNGRRLTSEREAQIRQRVVTGAYNSPSFVDELARRIIGSGDL